MAIDNNVDIAQRLVTLRKEQGLSQEELAEKLGLSRQAISKWERGESQPDMSNLIALADVYEVTIDEIVRWRPEREERDHDDSPKKNAPEPCSSYEDFPFPPPPQGDPIDVDSFAAASAAATCAPPPTPAKGKASPWFTFPYPLLVVLLFLLLGFCFHLWHPAWILFLTIPFYYWIAAVITRDPNYKESREL